MLFESNIILRRRNSGGSFMPRFPERNRQNESYNLGKETLTEITDNTGHFSRKEFMTTLLQGAQGRGMSASDAFAGAKIVSIIGDCAGCGAEHRSTIHHARSFAAREGSTETAGVMHGAGQ